MPPDERGQRPRGESLRTLPLEEGSRLRDELRGALAAAPRPVLVVLSGNEMGVRKRLEANVLIGRDPSADLVLTDAGVSWQHARIEDRGDGWALVDLGSTNGSSVNGVKKPELPLAHNDRVVLGRTVLRFEIQDPVEQAFDEQLQRMLDIDDLSGLYVKRAFDRELTRLLEVARVKGTRVALLVMDLDGVKKINDTHGHLFGAYTIGEAGRVLGRVLGARGIASRFGGDEFSAALPGLDAAAACAVGEELRAAIAAHHFEREGIVLKPGISIGVGVYPDAADAQASLFQRADEALYRAKQGGKNRVCL